MARRNGGLRPRDRARNERQRLLRSFWADARGWVVETLFAAALVLGFLGFRDYEAAVGGPTGFWDVFYRDLQLFVLESGAPAEASAIPLSLQVARLLAPVAAVAFLHRTLAPLLRDQLQLLRLQRFRGHVLVCGLGHRGLEVARTLRERGHRVVAIEQDEGVDHVNACRASGVPVLVGDATDVAVLRKAGLGRAGRLVAVCGDDVVNAKIAVATRVLTAGRAEPFDCLVHIFDPQLCSLLRAGNAATSDTSPSRIEFFNTFERGAQALLLLHPPFSDGDGSETRGDPHLLVVGLGRLGASLVVQAARTWRATHPDGLGRLRITVVDRNAASEVDSLKLRHPRLGEVAALDAIALDVCSPEFEHGGFLDGTRHPVSAAFVCLDDDILSLETALVLHKRLRGRRVPIVMRALSQAGLPDLLGDRDDEFDGLYAFPLLERVCDPDLLFGGTDEVIARALHDVYLQQRRSEGWRYGPERDEKRRLNPAVAPWDRLEERFRHSNRDQAAHTEVKLDRVGCALEASDEWDAPFSFTEAEIEVLAEMEHERWNVDQIRQHRDSPYLVPWSDLADNLREYDREFVRELPTILAKVGYRIVARHAAERR